jgi:hypothetical protein
MRITRRVLFFFERWLFYKRTTIILPPGNPKAWRKNWTAVVRTGEAMYCSGAKRDRDGNLRLIVWRRN